MTGRNVSIGGLIIIILISFVWALFAPKEEFRSFLRQKVAEQTKEPDLSFKKVIFSEVVDGITYWEIEAETSHVNNDTGLATLDRIKGKFFEDDRPNLKILAPKAYWNMKDKEIIIEMPQGENIPGAGSPHNYTFKADKLRWSLATKRIELLGHPEVRIK